MDFWSIGEPLFGYLVLYFLEDLLAYSSPFLRCWIWQNVLDCRVQKFIILTNRNHLGTRVNSRRWRYRNRKRGIVCRIDRYGERRITRDCQCSRLLIYLGHPTRGRNIKPNYASCLVLVCKGSSDLGRITLGNRGYNAHSRLENGKLLCITSGHDALLFY